MKFRRMLGTIWYGLGVFFIWVAYLSVLLIFSISHGIDKLKAKKRFHPKKNSKNDPIDAEFIDN